MKRGSKAEEKQDEAMLIHKGVSKSRWDFISLSIYI